MRKEEKMDNNILKIRENNELSKVLQENKYVVLDFYAD